MGKKKKTLGAGKKKIYFCTKVILSLACVLCSPPPSFSFLLWAVIYVVEKRLIWRGKRQFYSLKHFFCPFFFSQSWEESSASAPFGNCRLYFAIFCLSLSDGDVFSHYSFLFSCLFFFFKKRERWHFLSCSLWVVLMFSLSWTEKKVIKKKQL